MPKGARRLALRLLGRSARRAVLALCLLPVSLAQGQAQGTSLAFSDVLRAEYGAPTARYGHDVLGPNAEWGSLVLSIDRCPGCARLDRNEVTITLPDTRVFEDLAPRVVDLDGDGLHEVVVIESDASKGARLAIYDAHGFVTATPFIGTSYRWLAPLGAADLDGDGAMELAYIDRPHLAKTLRVWRYQDRSLSEVASLPGLTNHKIGQAFISGGIRECGSGFEIITADARWSHVMATTLTGGRLSTRKIGPFRTPDTLRKALNCL